MDTLQTIVLGAYDQMIGLELGDIAIDGGITKAPCGGEVAGRSPVDRGKQGLKRSTVVDAHGIPLALIAAPAHCHDAPLLLPTLDMLDELGPLPDALTAHLDRGYDSEATRERLAVRKLQGEIAEQGKPPPVTDSRKRQSGPHCGASVQTRSKCRAKHMVAGTGTCRWSWRRETVTRKGKVTPTPRIGHLPMTGKRKRDRRHRELCGKGRNRRRRGQWSLSLFPYMGKVEK